MSDFQHQSGEIEKPPSKISLSSFLDHFIPPELQVRPDAHRRARMFMLSHVFGPLLGCVIPLYLHFIVKIEMDYRLWIFFISIMVFWIYPFALRITGQYQALALISVQNLIFCIFWACYCYGGIYSPFLSWALTVPLLAFFYLPATGTLRNILLMQIFGSMAAFGALVVGGFRFPAVDLNQFQLIGIISTVSAAIYVVMMALYFANVFREQGEFQRELGGLMATADDMINLTAAAQQATTAKAEFIASMSHELRTPLNAVIGYSQLLLEDLEEDDASFARDMGRIHGAGTQLLRLVDDVLDFSKLEAGKMLSHMSVGSMPEKIGRILSNIAEQIADSGYALEWEIEDSGAPLNADWQTIKKAIHHLIFGIVADGVGGVIRLQATLATERKIGVRITDPTIRNGDIAAESLFDIFSNDCDATATKYGSMGIAFALSLKFAQLVGGEIIVETDPGERRVFALAVPAEVSRDVAPAAA